MKTIRKFFFPLIVVAAIGVISFLTECKKKTETIEVEVLVHDTLKGKSISGQCTYPDFTNAQVTAKGAVISLYLGTSASGTLVATAVSDTSGNYTFPYLLPNTYFITAFFNTENLNTKNPIDGISFITNPGYSVALGSTNLTQNISLSTVSPTGTLKISCTIADSIANPGSRYAPFESHSKCPWWTEYSVNGNGGNGGTTLEGGFNVFKVTEFYFDEANPANSKIKGYVLLSSINTMEPARDALTGCVPQTLQVDTLKVGTTATVLIPEADTAWYVVSAGQIEKYGEGYLAHGTLTAFYKHQGGDIVPPRISPLPADTGSWNGKGPSYAGPWNTRISNQIDMYFEYQGKNKVWNSAGTTFNWFFIFEGEFTFTRQQYYVKTSSIANNINVTPHVQLKGANNVEY